MVSEMNVLENKQEIKKEVLKVSVFVVREGIIFGQISAINLGGACNVSF